MKLRTAHLVFLFVISFVVFTGCRKPQEITEAQYKQVLAVAREEFLFFRQALFCRIPRMALKRGRIRRTTNRVIRKACRKADVPFKGFDEAHAKYSRLELTYSAEREELNGLLKVFSPAARKVFKEKEEHDKYWDADSAALANLDEAKVERVSWLTFDMGLPLGGKYRILVEVDKKGEAYIDGEVVSLKEYCMPIMVEDPYRLVHIMPDPQLPAGKLFDILDSVRATGAQRVDFSNKLSKSLAFKRPHSYAPSKEFVECAVLVEIMADDRVRINNDEIENSEASLDSLIETYFVLAEHKSITIVANDSASCGLLFKVGFAARNVYVFVDVFPLGSIRPASESRSLLM